MKKRSIAVLTPQTTPIKKKAAAEGRTNVPPGRIRMKDGQPVSVLSQQLYPAAFSILFNGSWQDDHRL